LSHHSGEYCLKKPTKYNEVLQIINHTLFFSKPDLPY